MVKSFGYYCARYVGFAVMITVAMVAIVYGMYAVIPDVATRLFEGGGGSGVGVVTVILPAMMVAQVFYKHEQRRMSRGEGWSMAVVFTVLAFAVSAAFFAASLQFAPLTGEEGESLSALWNDESSLLFTIGGVFAMFLVLINRLMLWSGVRGEMKKAERAAGKS